MAPLYLLMEPKWIVEALLVPPLAFIERNQVYAFLRFARVVNISGAGIGVSE